ncbi:DNA-directed RNA polymerase subunit beta [Paenibacillus donghaensis]|uniref:DNA-directed RNA polymerase subunit beta n=1 Tax=Paenibacillus donghaensis TaxID=414771 RepID=A0A2Z2KPG5_9BACL|nr:DNA-directed RNA polymerase subunit beta [Paenibacillus donghaensis]ASA24519.1 hypothetical protein B9T62_29465 [Paenibacillus donghaensis]
MSTQEKSKPDDTQKQERKRGISKWSITQWFLIPLLLVAALGGGLVAGYVIVGKREFSDVLQWSTWKHVYDLVFAP